jgi:siderophore synthetase component
VQRTAPAALALLAELAARATFLAQLHRTPSVEEWLRRVIQERVELEEAAFIGIKRSPAARTA